MNFPSRIVCLSAETAETLYLLGEEERVVGVSGFCTRPPQIRSKPRVSTFSDANIDAILELRPDLVLTFSDVQAEITRNLATLGLTVLHFNQRSVAEIFDMMSLLARVVRKEPEGDRLIADLRAGLERIASTAARFARRPRVYFEEWNEPLIGGIQWVEELVEIAGGQPIFPELRGCSKAQDRVIGAAEVVRRDPEVIFASWCGMKVKREEILGRAGWQEISAIRNGHVYEIPSNCILQPGPAALTEGVQMLHEKLLEVARLSGPADQAHSAVL